MAVRMLPKAWSGARTDTVPRAVSLPLAAVLGAALPILFLHVDYQPGFTVHAGSVAAHAVLSDFVVLAVAAAALAAGITRGFAPLRAGVPVWIAGAAFLVMVAAATAYPLLSDRHYSFAAHVVTAAKFLEYALLALAVPLLVRDRRDVDLVLASLAAWSVVATAVAVLQFFGVSIFEAWAAGRRQPSFLGHHDFAALSGAALAVALVAIVLGRTWPVSRGVAVSAGVAGGLGLVLSGSTAGAIGLAAGAAAVALAARLRHLLSPARAAAVAAVAAAVVAGVVLLRSGDFDQFLRFAGVRQEERSSREQVQTYVQHTLLAYIGWRIFLDHPVVGAGWQASVKEESTYGPYLADARRAFPDAPPLAFPSPQHPWGIQNAYVQALADLGAIGLALFLVLFAAGLWVAARAALRAPPAVAAAALVAALWLIVAMGVWSAIGLVAAIPLDALMWLGLGLAVAASAGARLVRA